MARLINSPLEGLRGTLGDLVFRTWGGKTFVSVKPNKPKRQTAAQKATRIKFTEAAFRAKAVLEDSTMQRYYTLEALRLNLPNAYAAALREQMLNA
jgi:hypothetical protein